jgi:hypothetical protein
MSVVPRNSVSYSSSSLAMAALQAAMRGSRGVRVAMFIEGRAVTVRPSKVVGEIRTA